MKLRTPWYLLNYADILFPLVISVAHLLHHAYLLSKAWLTIQLIYPYIVMMVLKSHFSCTMSIFGGVLLSCHLCFIATAHWTSFAYKYHSVVGQTLILQI